MKPYWILLVAALLICKTTGCQSAQEKTGIPDWSGGRIIFVYGNGLEKEFIRYVAELTEKKKPVICFLPTAAADNPRAIDYWNDLCSDLPVQPVTLRTFISSSPEQKTHEEQIMSAAFSEYVKAQGGAGNAYAQREP